ncbi:MAG: hypothetical protein JWM57_697 [Phycisphaerales bacterium]|nr:hypothetical protein [Phycisphaerales bacterium]
MSNVAKVFGRTKKPVAPVWREQADGSIVAGDWTGLILHPDDLDRHGGERVRERRAMLGWPFEFVVVRDLLANDLKVGWPLHRLQRFRDEGLCKWFVIETHDSLEAEWIAANAPVHGVILTYTRDDLSARYRVFDAAANGGVALIGHADSSAAAALHLATPQIAATLLSPGVNEPKPLSVQQAEALWTSYAANNPEPAKLRGGHPPDFGT